MTHALPLFDDRALSANTGGDPALATEIVQIFCEHAPLQFASYRGAATPVARRIAAHSLKGSANSVGASRLALAAAEAEREAIDGQLPSAERTEKLALLLVDTLAALKRANPSR